MQAAHGALAMPVVMLTGQGVSNWPCRSCSREQDYLVKGQLTADTLQRHYDCLQHRASAPGTGRAPTVSAPPERDAGTARGGTHCPPGTHARHHQGRQRGLQQCRGLQYAVQRICAYIRWPVGHAWLPVASDGGRWAPTSIWHLDAPERLTAFQQATQSVEFVAGEDLIGQVGALGKPVWSMDITTDPAFSRRQAALAAGLTTGFAIPLLVGPEVVGVSSFMTPSGGRRMPPCWRPWRRWARSSAGPWNASAP